MNLILANTVPVPAPLLVVAGLAALVLLVIRVMSIISYRALKTRCHEQEGYLVMAHARAEEQAESIAQASDRLSEERQNRSLDVQRFEQELVAFGEDLRHRDTKIQALHKTLDDNCQAYAEEREEHEQLKQELHRVQHSFRSLYAGIAVCSAKAMEDQPVLINEAHDLLGEIGVNVRVEIVADKEGMADEVLTTETASV